MGDLYLPVVLVVLPSGAFPKSSRQGSTCLHSGLVWMGARNRRQDTGLTSPATRSGESALDPLKKGQSWSGRGKKGVAGPFSFRT